VTPEQRARFLADHNELLELIELAAQHDKAGWDQRIEARPASVNTLWLATQLAAHAMEQLATARSKTLLDALHDLRVAALREK
jgi:hypothetical protein